MYYHLKRLISLFNDDRYPSSSADVSGTNTLTVLISSHHQNQYLYHIFKYIELRENKTDLFRIQAWESIIDVDLEIAKIRYFTL